MLIATSAIVLVILDASVLAASATCTTKWAESFSWNLLTFNLCASKDLFQLQFDREVSQEKTCQMAHHKCTAAKEYSSLLQ